MKSIFRALTVIATAACLAPSGGASAAEPERVVVRNRLYDVDGTWEGSAAVGMTMVNYLTQHTNLALGLGYNLSENFALQLDLGYAISRQTNVAAAAASEVVRTDPTKTQKVADDFEDLWQMTWNATGALRWTPIYGKLNIAAELPVHFQLYLLAGAGVGGMTRDSLVYCIGQPANRSAASCSASPDPSDPNALTALHETAVKPLFVGGVGLRFFVTQWFGLRVEVRDVAFPDSYRIGISRVDAEADVSARDGGTPSQGTPAASPGLTNLVFAQVGAVFNF